MGDSFGQLFRITTWGESHGGGVGVVIDGCPSGLLLCEDDLQYELDRRRPGQSKITTQRKESDSPKILSGIFEGRTTGTAISIMVLNKDAKPHSYDHLKDLYRPSHADYTFEQKYGFRDWMGGGRSSARETVARVAAGAVAKKLLHQLENIKTIAWVEQIHEIKSTVNKNDVSEICKTADGAVIGSSIVKIIENNLNNKEKMMNEVSSFIEELKKGTE